MYTSGVGAALYTKNASTASLIDCSVVRSYGGDGAISAGIDSFLRVENVTFVEEVGCLARSA
jgi:hypothetical protein